MLNLNFDLYPFLIAFSILIDVFLIEFYFRKNGYGKENAIAFELNLVIAAFFGVVGAILRQSLYDFIENPHAYHFTWSMTFFGGLLFGAGSFLLGYYFVIRKKYPKSLSPILSLAGACIPFSHGIGRIGCFLDGCCYGKPVPENSPFAWIGIKFHTTSVKVYPTNLFECIFLLLLASILFYLVFKKHSSYTLPIYRISYGIFRFLMEYLRGDHRGNFIPGISPSQFWSLRLFISGILYFVLLLILKRNKFNSETN